MTFLKFLARKHEKDPEAAKLISQTESEVLAAEAHKAGKSPHRAQ